MSDPVIEIGNKVYIITRRLFEGDVQRHFVGEITRSSNDLQQVLGYAFVFQPGTNEYKKRPELRTRIFSMAEAGLIVFKIPREVAIESIEYRKVENRFMMTDGDCFVLDIDEFGPSQNS